MSIIKALRDLLAIAQECRWNESLQNDWGTGPDASRRMILLDTAIANARLVLHEEEEELA